MYTSYCPPIISSCHVFFGYDKSNNKDYTFRDTKGIVHSVPDFETAKSILFQMYKKRLNNMGIDNDAIESSIRKSPNANYAYLSMRVY